MAAEEKLDDLLAAIHADMERSGQRPVSPDCESQESRYISIVNKYSLLVNLKNIPIHLTKSFLFYLC